MADYTLTQWMLVFYIYCVAGWVWESAYVSVKSHRLVNRGFLKGPWLPIYGSGAVCILAVTIPFRDNPVLMCLVGMVSATVLEYVTGYVMERLFRVRYWDYTGKFLNLNGYVCAGSTLCWGVMTLLVVEVAHQYVERLVLAVSDNLIDGLALLLTVLFTVDFVTSFMAAMRLRDVLIQKERITEELRKLAEKKKELELLIQETGDKMVDKAKEQVRLEMQEIYMKAGAQKEKLRIAYSRSIRGLLERNPTAVSLRHKESFAELKQNLMNKIETFRMPEEFDRRKDHGDQV